MKKNRILQLALSTFFLTSMLQLHAADGTSSNAVNIGVVNFKSCVEKSKLGKAEQQAFESLKEQMSTILEKTEKELNDIASKLSDTEHLDSLSAEAENELKTKFQALSQELARYQNQYYQILNQANFKLIHELSSKVGESAEAVAKVKKIDLVLNEDACFFYAPTLEITSDVIVELDKRFDAEQKEAQNTTKPEPIKK